MAPSTTATALTSITTGLPPAVHEVVGYRVRVHDDAVLNVLRWRTGAGRRPPGRRPRRVPDPSCLPRVCRPGRDPGGVRGDRVHRRPPGRRPPPRVADGVVDAGAGRRPAAGGRAVRLRLLRRRRQDRPRAGVRPVLRRRAAGGRPAGQRPGRPPSSGGGAGRHRRPRAGGGGRRHLVLLGPELLGLHRAGLGRGPLPVAARPSRVRGPLGRGGPVPASGTLPGSGPSTTSRRRDGSAARSRRPLGTGSATSPSSPTNRWRSWIRPIPASWPCGAATARSRRPRCSFPSSPWPSEPIRPPAPGVAVASHVCSAGESGRIGSRVRHPRGDPAADRRRRPGV